MLALFLLCAGGWALLNGILHDVFILAQKRPYDRDLLRLLLDGHILITCGAVQMLCYPGLLRHDVWSLYISLACSISLLVYCVMIFKFLKAIGMMLIQIVSIGVIVYSLLS